MDRNEKIEILKRLESLNPYDFNDCDGNPYDVVEEQIDENPSDVVKYLLNEIDDLEFLHSEMEKKFHELKEDYVYENGHLFDDSWGTIKYLLGEIDDWKSIISEREKKYEELELKYRSIVGYGSDEDRAYETDDDDDDDDDNLKREE